MMCGKCSEDDELLGVGDLLVNEDGEVYESTHPRMLSAPSPPSKQEAQEHALTHLPFRSWCPFCVKGKSKASPHLVGHDCAEKTVPLVAFDYCFMGDRADTEHDNINILAGRDSVSRCYAVVPVPAKGVAPE